MLEDSCPLPLTPDEISEASEGDSMKDFIVDDEEGEEKSEGEDNPQEKQQATSSRLLEYHMPSCKIYFSCQSLLYCDI